MNGWYKALEQIVWVTQLGFSLLFPLVCLLGGCWWLTTRLGVGMWVYAPGILLGLALGAYTFASTVRYWFRQQDKEDQKAKQPRRGGYNSH